MRNLANHDENIALYLAGFNSNVDYSRFTFSLLIFFISVVLVSFISHRLASAFRLFPRGMQNNVTSEMTRSKENNVFGMRDIFNLLLLHRVEEEHFALIFFFYLCLSEASFLPSYFNVQHFVHCSESFICFSSERRNFLTKVFWKLEQSVLISQNNLQQCLHFVDNAGISEYNSPITQYNAIPLSSEARSCGPGSEFAWKFDLVRRQMRNILSSFAHTFNTLPTTRQTRPIYSQTLITLLLKHQPSKCISLFLYTQKYITACFELDNFEFSSNLFSQIAHLLLQNFKLTIFKNVQNVGALFFS